MTGPECVGLLAPAVRALAGARDEDDALSVLADLLVRRVAHWCLADRIDAPDVVTRVAAVGRTGPLDLPAGMGSVHPRRSSAQAVGVLSQLLLLPRQQLRLGFHELQQMAGSPDPRLRIQAQLALGLGSTDVLVLALTSRDVLLGVLAIGRTEGRFADVELEELLDLAQLAGLALAGLRLQQVQRSVSTALQQSLLPALPVVAGLALAARFVPAGDGLAVGGDWYDAFVLTDGEVALVIGDATGHDVLAAARMAELRNLLRALALDRAGPPSSTLARLDAVISQVAAELSATCLYAQLDTATGLLRWSSAGHLPPVLLRGGRAELLETAPELMLGVRETSPRHDHQCTLVPGDVLVLYTDGLVEDRLRPVDEGLAALLREVDAFTGSAPEGLVDVLVAQLAGGGDDVAVLAVRVDG